MTTGLTQGICFSQDLTDDQLHMIKSTVKPHVPITWFVKGAAVKLFNEPQGLKKLHDLFGPPLEILACSSACDTLQIQHAAIQMNNGCLAGLGTWVDLTLRSSTIDFSCCSLLPHFVVVHQDPFKEPELFNDQLDLAFAAAAFDLTPTLLIVGKANECLPLLKSSANKRIQSAHIYGIETILAGVEAEQHLKSQLSLASQQVKLQSLQPHLQFLQSNDSTLPIHLRPFLVTPQ